MTTAHRFQFRRTTSVLLLALAGTAGCGSSMSSGSPTGGSNITISTQPLAGKIGGQAWTFSTGETDAFLSDADGFFTTLYPTSYTTCSFGKPTDVNEVLLDLPTAPGSYDLSLAMNATLYESASNNNRVATRGRVVVDSVTATTITGGMHLIYDANNTVDGQFEVTICP